MSARHPFKKKLLAFTSCLMLAMAMVPLFGFVSNSQAEAAPSAHGFIWPLQTAGKITQHFAGTNHTGTDIAVGYGSNVVSSQDGRVKYVQNWDGYSKTGMQSYGNLVVVYHPSSGASTYYAHLSSISVKLGQSVKMGEVVGKVGSTGYSSGNHLHFELHTGAKSANGTYGRSDGTRVNPLNYLSSSNIGPAPNSAPSKATLSGASYPTSLKVGQCFGVKGTVSSSSNITAVSAAVYNTAGKWVTGGSAKPNTTSYNLVKLDNYVRFDKLSAGTYTYAIYATNSAGQVCLLSKRFSVGQKYSQPTLSGANYPTSIRYGRCFGLYGTIYGNGSNLRSVTAAVYTTGGSWKTGKTLSVNTGSVSIAKSLDNYVLFNRLPRGTYVYKVVATNGAGTYTLLSRQFKVY